jgi:hypothetical protein
MRQITADLNTRDIDVSDARVPYGALQQPRQFLMQEMADALGAFELPAHALILEASSDFVDVEYLYEVADFDIGIVLHANAAFRTVTHFIGVILEAT